MQGISERQYAARVGLSRGAIQKAKAAGRLVLHEDGSIDAEASDARRCGLERQAVIAAVVNDLSRHLAITVQRITGDNFTFEINVTEHFEFGVDFIALVRLDGP